MFVPVEFGKNYKSFLLKSGKTNRKRRKEEATQVGRLSAQSHTKIIWSSTKSYRKLRQVYYYKSELGELVWQVFYSELEFLILLPLYACVAKQRKLQNTSLLHVLFIQDKDNKLFLIPKTSPLLFQTQSFYRSFCTGLCL